ncbi:MULTISPECIES: amino acid permease [Paraburkholderia]|uniref:Amino acid permease n=1 Tax=Paraburkholderia dioscoreae TaxID=2604047 RepID=A0A5Q4Z1M1_9BURK|nr:MULTISPECIES: amino acid permease [Paraburkholderia]MDR8397521.1 amino acid permease [Paraburkholderia sp. USG1]VVD27072.1 Amino acid permease [Paraburkholderia dioscoreae]
MSVQRNFSAIATREGDLEKRLTQPQLTMIAIGSAIGTGLFLGSGAAIQMAGPSVILSYAIGAVVALLLMGCLGEMVVAHPTTGSFGAYAEHYLGEWMGFLVRYAYWVSVVLVIGAEVTAISVYMKFWFPGSPGWLWVTLFSALLILVNASSVKIFGTAEYWFAIIKVIAIVAFILVGSYMIYRAPANSDIGFHNYLSQNGFFPKGLSGTWFAVVIAIFSFIGIEFIAVAAGEATHPQQAARSAFKSAFFRLFFFYIFTVALMVAIVPWQSAGTGQSPFVLVMQLLGVPFGASIMNFVVLTAALSAMNAQLYVATRMIFSLSRAGHAPAFLGKVNRNGSPLRSLIFSTFGVGFAAVCSIVVPQDSFLLMMSIAMFGALFAWFMIFVTHYRFRRIADRDDATLSFRIWGFPFLTIAGGVLMFCVMATTLLLPAFRMTLLTGIPLLVVLSVVFPFVKGRAVSRNLAKDTV